MAVTPFLPPPFGPAITGVLSLVNMILELVGDSKPETESPFEQLSKYIYELFNSTQLDTWRSIFQNDVNMAFYNQMDAFKTSIDKIDIFDKSLQDFQDNINKTWSSQVHTAIGEIFTLMEKQQIGRDFDVSYLSALLAGVTFYITLQKAYVQLCALDASISYKNKDYDSFNDKSDLFVTALNKLNNAIGNFDQNYLEWTDEQRKTALESNSWIPRIQSWISNLHDQRMGKISAAPFRREPAWDDPYYEYTWWDELAVWLWNRADFSAQGQDVYVSMSSHYYKYCDFYDDSWKKLQGSEDYGQPENGKAIFAWPVARDCCGNVAHAADKQQAFDTLQKEINDYRTAASDRFRKYLADYVTQIESWAAFVDGFEDLAPMPKPDIGPNVEPLANGPGLAHGSGWVQGGRVRYSFAIANERGPSQSGPWSCEMTIDRTAFATISGFPNIPNKTSLHIYRQFCPQDDKWGAAKLVTILDSPLPSTYDDQSD
jgi:hypothetical protein